MLWGGQVFTFDGLPVGQVESSKEKQEKTQVQDQFRHRPAQKLAQPLNVSVSSLREVDMILKSAAFRVRSAWVQMTY